MSRNDTCRVAARSICGRKADSTPRQGRARLGHQQSSSVSKARDPGARRGAIQRPCARASPSALSDLSSHHFDAAPMRAGRGFVVYGYRAGIDRPDPWRGGRMKRGIVGDAQILAKPHDYRCTPPIHTVSPKAGLAPDTPYNQLYASRPPPDQETTSMPPNAVVELRAPGGRTVRIGNRERLAIIAGPCQMQSRSHAWRRPKSWPGSRNGSNRSRL